MTVLSRMLDGDEFNGGTPYRKNHEANLFNKKIINTTHPTANADAVSLRGYFMLMLMRADDYVKLNPQDPT